MRIYELEHDYRNRSTIVVARTISTQLEAGPGILIWGRGLWGRDIFFRQSQPLIWGQGLWGRDIFSTHTTEAIWDTGRWDTNTWGV